MIDNFDELGRLRELIADGALEQPARADAPAEQPVLVRVTPDVAGDTHDKISTGQANSKFGFSMDQAPAALEQAGAVDGLRLLGVHAHIGSQLLELTPFARAAAALASLGEHPVWDLGGGLGVRYTSDQQAPAHDRGVRRGGRLGRPPRAAAATRPCCSSRAAACVPTPRSRCTPSRASSRTSPAGWRSTAGMSDNLRPMLYGARYEAHLADRPGGSVSCVLAGKHCESGDVIVREATLDDPRPGDVVVTPATGAYGYAMANNYNGVPRPPVLFCRDGDARPVVRRESFEDLLGRDVR